MTDGKTNGANMADFDIGVHIDVPAATQGGNPTPANSTHWTFTGATWPCAGFVGDRFSGSWAPLNPYGVNPISFVPIALGDETFTGYCNNRWADTSNLYRIRQPRLGAPPTPVLGTVSIATVKGELCLLSGDPAIRFDFTTGDNNGCQGQLSIIQLIQSTRTARTAQKQYVRSTKNQFVLDTISTSQTYLYNGTMTALGNPVQFVDSPRRAIKQDELEVTVDESFKTILVFMSTQAPLAYWIPLYMVEWGWSGCAKKINNSWQVDTTTSRVFASPPRVPPSPAILTWMNHIEQIQEV